MYIYNYSKLRGRITEKFGNQGKFCKEIKMPRTTLSTKLNNRSEFGQSEILELCEPLEIKLEEIKDYFFSYFSSQKINKIKRKIRNSSNTKNLKGGSL